MAKDIQSNKEYTTCYSRHDIAENNHLRHLMKNSELIIKFGSCINRSSHIEIVKKIARGFGNLVTCIFVLNS